MSLLTRSAWLRGGCALGFAAAMANASALPPDKVYAKAAPSVWRVFVFDAEGKALGQGSGVVIGKETMLTNCHVVEKARHFQVKQDNISFDARLQYVDPVRDMCQLLVPHLNAPAIELANSDQLAVGQRVYALGNPKGMELTLSDGLISSLRKDQNDKLALIQTTAPISPGSSGGGLFDEDARLIGLTTMQLKEAQNINFAVPINWVHDLAARSDAFLKQARQALARGDVKPPPARTPAPAPAPAPAAPASPQAPAPAASGYADINDLSKFDGFRPQVREAYQQFLLRPLPRAFALSEDGGSYQAWSRTPRDPADSADPAVRVISGCEKFHHSRCRLYAVDRVVVYRPIPQ
jgi:S1-C subfamily serine protease